MVGITVSDDIQGHEEWHLPTYDPRNENKYHYKLASLDIYFWTQQDALQFVNAIRRVLPPSQCEVLDEPGPPTRQQPSHSSEMSSVVQKLEKAALTDKPAQAQGANNGIPSFAPPPLSAVSNDSSEPQAVFQPMAYNPAAPAAPEQIRHREKTPPPEDGIANPLHQTLAYDAATPFSPGLVPTGLGPLSPGVPPPQFHSPPGAPSFAAPPVASPGFAPQGWGGYTHPGLSRAATMPATHAMQSPGLISPFSPAFPGSPGYPGTPGMAQHPGHPQPHHTPTPPGVASPGLPPPPPQQGQGTYGMASAGSPSPFNIHQQQYVPGEGEGPHKYKPKAEVRGKLEENAGRLERGLTGALKKFEKRFG